MRRPTLYQGISEGPGLLANTVPGGHETGQRYASSDAFVFDEDTCYAIGFPVSPSCVARALSVASCRKSTGVRMHQERRETS